MITIDGINTIMERIGSGEETIEAVARTGDTEWAVAFESGAVVSIELLYDEGRLLLTALLGRPPADRRDALCRTLLSYNALWARTGVVMALGGEGGQVIQSSALDVLGIDAPRLSAALVNFARKAAVWRDALANGQAGGPEMPLILDTGSSDAWIRA